MSDVIFMDSCGRDDVAFEERLEQVRPVVVDVLVREHEAHVAVRQRQAVDLVEGEVAVIQAEVEAALAERVGALGVDGPEALCAPDEHPQAGSYVYAKPPAEDASGKTRAGSRSAR